jgi:CheY-like chemotaxis protein
LRVLVAEDNLTNQKLLMALLEREGHYCQVASDGKAVLAALAEGRFDLVLMDVQMPELDGWQTTAEIRQREAMTHEHLPIVALTAMAATKDRDQCLRSGMDDILLKPIRIPEFTRVLRWACERKLRGNNPVVDEPQA